MAIRYCASPPGQNLAHDLGEMRAVFHRPSGQTHLLAEPAPQILEALTQTPQTADQIIAALSLVFDLDAADLTATDAVAARLDELAKLGLAVRVPQGTTDAV